MSTIELEDGDPLTWTWTCPRCGSPNEEWGNRFRQRFCAVCGEPNERIELSERDERPVGVE